MTDVPVAFVVDGRRPAPGLVVCVNFGLATGREATFAEIDRLGSRLQATAGAASIVSQTRHEFGARSEAEVHQVLVELPADADAELVVREAELWAAQCAADRGYAA